MRRAQAGKIAGPYSVFGGASDLMDHRSRESVNGHSRVRERFECTDFQVLRAAVALAFLMAVAVGCGGEEIPDPLIGVWMATSPTHRGRFIEISKEHLIFSSDEDHSTFYTIIGVETSNSEGKSTYTIAYHGSGDFRRTLVVRLAKGNPPSIQLQNNAGRWVRKDEMGPKQKESI